MSSVPDDMKLELERLVLDPVPELSELLECEPPMDELVAVLEGALLFRDMLEPVAAIGADTLLVWVWGWTGPIGFGRPYPGTICVDDIAA
jgi:hypothetical protein